MPLPGPPAEKEPPPPIIMLSTQKAMKSGSPWAQLSSPTTMWANSGKGVGPRLTLERSFSTWEPTRASAANVYNPELKSTTKGKADCVKVAWNHSLEGQGTAPGIKDQPSCGSPLGLKDKSSLGSLWEYGISPPVGTQGAAHEVKVQPS